MKLELGLMRFAEQLRIKRENDKRFIFDPIRRKWLALQPEEMVRQLVLLYLLEEKNYSRNRINMERGLKVNQQNQRFDLLAYDEDVRPFLLVECKAPQVPINQDAFRQAARYNMALQVKYLLVTNGRESYCCVFDYETKSYRYLEEVPDFG